MDNMEIYWAIANQTIAIINIFIEGWLVYGFLKPFMKKKTYYVGVSYSLVMLILYCVPWESDYPYLLGILKSRRGAERVFWCSFQRAKH